jgi:glycosyltransferase involved in cell wall biosynthesis
MNIGIDARIAYYNRSGLYRYLIGLLKPLTKNTSQHSFKIFQSWKQPRPLDQSQNATTKLMFTPCHCPWEKYLLPLELCREKLDLFHIIDFYAPLTARFRTVFTIHDLYFLKDKDAMDKAGLKHYQELLNYLPQAAHVICDSFSTKDDLLSYASIDPAKVSVIYPGLVSEFYSISAQSAAVVKTKYRLPDNYFLFVGTIEPRKNLVRTIEAYHMAAKKLGDKMWPMFLAGRCAYKASEVLDTISSLSLSSKVKYLGELAEDEILGLYHGASALLYVSLYEGFGFPILEAMATRTAIITSNTSSLGEVAQDAALFADPLNTESIAGNIVRIVEEASLREDLIAKGLRRVQDFSWENTAAQVLGVYDRISKS